MVRLQRMIDSAPEYYQTAIGYRDLQRAVAAELDLLTKNSADLARQRRIATATWGLKYWEERVGLPTILSDTYEIRRSRVLSKWRGVGQFRASLIKSVAEAYSNGEVEVEIDVAKFLVTVKFSGATGIPPNIDDLKAAIDNIIHAHLGIEYTLAYLTWDMLDEANMTWDEIDALNMTWDEFEVWKP